MALTYKVSKLACWAHQPPQSPGEIKRSEVSWTLTKKFNVFAGPGKIKKREVVLDPQVSPRVGRWSWA